MKAAVKKIYASFDQRRKIAEANEADTMDAIALKEVEDKLKRKN